MFRTSFFLFALALTGALFLSGCAGPGKAPTRTPDKPARTPAAQTRSLEEQADFAWERGNTVRAETLYQQLVRQPNLAPDMKTQAWERYTRSAVANDHYHLALEALAAWRQALPDAPDSDAWRSAARQAVAGIGQVRGAERPLRDMLMDPTLPWPLRSEAGLLLTKYFWDQGRLQDSMKTLALLHQEAKVAEVADQLEAVSSSKPGDYQAELEAGLFRELQELSSETLDRLTETATAETANQFPYTIIALEQHRRAAANAEDWPKAWQAMRRLASSGELANRELAAEVLGPLEEEYGQPMHGVTLALPLSGPFSGVGWKILRGAGVAQQKLAGQGVEIVIHAVNTEQDGWIEQMETIEPSFALTGGPLRGAKFAQLQASSADRVVFGFLPSLREAAEGQDAWRFFASPLDQVNADLDLAHNTLHLDRMSVLYPQEPYGERMAQLFTQAVRERGLSLRSSKSYPTGKIEDWNQIVADFLGVNRISMRQENALPPEPGIDAVFIPDSWSNTQILVPQFFFFQEERLVVLGTALWGQALENSSGLEMRNYGLAAFPGAWAPDAKTPAVIELRAMLEAEALGEPDFWVALGYDFVRFSNHMGALAAGWTPEDVNERVQTAQRMEWTMAPVSWSAEGLASQDLFMFQPAAQGVTQVDASLMTERLENARRRHAWWVQTILDKRQAAKEKAQQTGTNDALKP